MVDVKIAQIEKSTFEIVLAREDDRISALLSGNIDAIEGFLAPDFIYLHGAGRVDDKTSYIASLREGVIEYLDLRRLDVQAAVGSDVVTLVYDLINKRRRGDQVNQFHLRTIATWRKSNDQWQALSIATLPLLDMG